MYLPTSDAARYIFTLRSAYKHRLEAAALEEIELRLALAGDRRSANFLLCAADRMASDRQYEKELSLGQYIASLRDSPKLPIYYSGEYSDARQAISGIRLEAEMNISQFSKVTGICRNAIMDPSRPKKNAISTSLLNKVLDVFDLYPSDATSRLIDLARAKP